MPSRGPGPGGRPAPTYQPDAVVLYDGSIILYDSRTERWAVSSTEEVAASDQRRLTSRQSPRQST